MTRKKVFGGSLDLFCKATIHLLVPVYLATPSFSLIIPPILLTFLSYCLLPPHHTRYSVSGDDRVYALDVVRHLLPDVVVFATTLLTLIFNAMVVAGLVRERKEGDEKRRREMETGRDGQTREGSAEHVATGSSEAAESGKNLMLHHVYM